MNKKGFTLIELLAIIVILAIIAVITVPLILGIIDNAKEKAVIDSAYGYKDAVNKMYTTKLLNNKDYKMEDRAYTISEFNTEGLSISGKEPDSNSWIQIENNNVKAGCLQFDEYKVNINNGIIGITEKGQCPELVISSCPGCVFAFTTTNWYYTGANQTTLDSTQYYYDYNDVIAQTGKKYFLGLILDNNKISRAFACGIHDNGTPFCIEGTTDDSKIESNMALLNSEELWNGECCRGNINASSTGHGAPIGVSDNTGYCFVFSSGELSCYKNS